MNPGAQRRLALIIRGRPYARRAPRADLDLALAAAALDFELEIYFIGEAILQLAAGHDGAAAGLPRGYRAWAAVPDLADVRMYAERAWLRRCEKNGMTLQLPVEGLDPAQMRSGWRECRQALVV